MHKNLSSIIESSFNVYDTRFNVYTLTSDELKTTTLLHLKKYDNGDIITADIIDKIYSEYSVNVPYHNFYHVFCVFQMAMILIGKIKISKKIVISDDECLGFLLICLCHDIGHGGESNAKICLTDFEQDDYWKNSKMEQSHYNIFYNLMKNNFSGHFDKLFPQLDFVKTLFKVTDLPQHFVVTNDLNNKTEKYTKEFILQIILIFSDVSGCVRSELYNEIICEKLKEEIITYHSEFPDLKEKMLNSLKNQTEFIEIFVRPLIIYLNKIISTDDVISTNLISF